MSDNFKGGYQQIGFLVFQDEDNYIKFSYENGNRIKVVRETGGSTAELQSETGGIPAAGTTMYMRILRSGDEYAFYYSADGLQYKLAGKASLALQTVSLGLEAVNSFSGNPSSIDVAFEYVRISEMSTCTCTVESVQFSDRTVGLSDAQLGYYLRAGVTVGGDCAIPGHDASTASYQYELAADGENTAGVTIEDGLLKATRTGYVDVTVRATLASGAVGTKTARLTIKDIAPTTVATLIADEVTSPETHAMIINKTLDTAVDISAYEAVYLEFDVKVDSTHTSPAPANDAWVKYVKNGYVKLDGTSCGTLGYNAKPSSFTKGGTWNHVRMVVSLSCSCNRLSTLCHTSEMEFNESAPFPRIMRFSLSVSGKITPHIISNQRRKVHTYTNTKYKIFFFSLNRFRKKIRPISGVFSEKWAEWSTRSVQNALFVENADFC